MLELRWAQLSALWWPRGVGGRGWGRPTGREYIYIYAYIYIYLCMWLILFIVQQKLIQHCKALILQLNRKRNEIRKGPGLQSWVPIHPPIPTPNKQLSFITCWTFSVGFHWPIRFYYLKGKCDSHSCTLFGICSFPSKLHEGRINSACRRWAYTDDELMNTRVKDGKRGSTDKGECLLNFCFLKWV